MKFIIFILLTILFSLNLYSKEYNNDSTNNKKVVYYAGASNLYSFNKLLIDPNKVNNQSNLGSGFNLFFEKPYDSTMNNNFILSFGLYKKNLIYDDYIEDNKNYKNQEKNDYFTIQFIYKRKLLEYNNNRIFISGGSFIGILLKS